MAVRGKYAVRLTSEERESLQRLVRGGKSPARTTTRARILLKTGDGWPVPQVDEAYLEVEVVRVVLDNPVSSTRQALNTHRVASLYEAFPAAEARRIAKRLEFHYPPSTGVG